MMKLLLTILLVGVMCTPVFGAATAKDRLKSAADSPSTSQGTGDSAKSRLKATTSGTAADGNAPERPSLAPSSAKGKLSEATDGVPSYGTFSSDNSRCAYLTKPNVREDGGGLNAHAGGSVVCHLGRIMYCSGGVWKDSGNCDWPKEKQAYWIEGSDPPGTPAQQGGPEGPGGGSSAGGGNEPPGGQGGVLLGQNPREQELERERQQLQNEVQQLRQLQQNSREGQRQGPPSQQGPGNPQTGTANRTTITGVTGSFTCADAKSALPEIDRMMREIEAYSRATTTVPGAIHHIYQEQYNQMANRRPQIEQWMRENNCH